METELETVVRSEEGIRVSVDTWDEGGAYLHFIAKHGSMGVVLNRQEAQQILSGLKKVLDSFNKETAHV